MSTRTDDRIGSDILRDNLKALSEAVGVSGGESEVRKLILERIKDHVTDVVIDPMGNVTCVQKGTGQIDARVMVSAHMDEIGFMVTGVNEDGTLRIVGIGTHDGRYVPAKRVQVGGEKTPGVFMWVPIHKSMGKNDVVPLDSHVIDLGADAKGGVRAKPGDRVAFMGDYAELNGAVIRGKAFESRAGCTALIELLTTGDPFPFDLCAAFTVQEQIGGRGAGLAAYRLDPAAAFVLRGVECGDLPRDPEEDRAPQVRFGGGPAISLFEQSFVTERRLVDHLISTARANAIPYQISANATPLASVGRIGRARAGVSGAVIGIPVRYLPSPNGLLHLADLENTTRLLRAALDTLSAELLQAQTV